MPQQASQERRNFLITLVVIVLVAGGLGAVLAWSVKKRAQLEKDIQAVNREIEGYQKKIDEIPKLKAEHKALLASQKKILEKLPEGHEVEALIEQINNESAKAGVELRSFRKERVPRAVSGQGASATASYDMFIYSMLLSGRYDQFVNFIYQIEYEMPRFVKVDSFKIEAYESGLLPDQPKHTFDLKLVTLSYSGRVATSSAKSARSRSKSRTTDTNAEGSR